MPDRRAALVLLAFSALLIATIVLRARAKPFWHDEIYTIVCARLPGVATLWRAQREGLDLGAPLNAILTRAAHRVGGEGRVATRLPPIAGYCAASAILFLFVRRRASIAASLAAATLPCFTAALRYAYEARGYGLMLGFGALTLYAWAEAAAGRRRALNLVLLPAALAGGCWSHYYAVFTFAPIAIGEAVRSLRTRTVDRAMWAAIAIGALAAAPLWALARTAVAQFGTMWRHASTADVAATYAFLLQPSLNATFAWAAAVIAIICVTAAFGGRRREAGAPRRMARHEAAAIVAWMLLPILQIAVAMAIGGIFVPRYAMSAVIGFAAGIPLLVWRAGDAVGVAETLLALVLGLNFAASALDSIRHPPAFVDPVAERPLFAAALRQPRPLAVTGGLMFLQLWYYTPPDARGRLWYIADPAEARRYTGSDTMDRGFQVLSRWAGVNVADYQPFVTMHPAFQVYTAGSGWLTDRLADDRAQMRVTGEEPGGRLIDVTVR